MALFSFGLPTMEIANGKEPVAVVFVSSRRFVVRKIKLIDHKYFILADKQLRGIYETDDKHVFFYEKTPVLFYDYRNGKPTNPLIANELVEFAEKNRLHKISRKDVKHAALLRVMQTKSDNPDEAMEKTKQLSGEKQNKIDSQINDFFAQTEEQNKKDLAAKKPLTYGTPEQYTYALTDFLFRQDLITKDEGMLLEERVRSHNMTFDELINDLRTKEVVTIRSPITPEQQLFLDDFHTYDPARMSSNIDYLKNLDKKLVRMTSIPIKNWIPATLVLAIAIGGIMGIMVLITQWSQIQGLFEKLMPPHLILGMKSFIMSKLHS